MRDNGMVEGPPLTRVTPHTAMKYLLSARSKQRIMCATIAEILNAMDAMPAYEPLSGGAMIGA
jgi:hypothetical protein